MNYETATDFELNKRLADLYLPCDYIFNEGDSKVELANYQDVMIGYVHDQVLTAYAEFNPCNNWNDIMPIAVDLGVSLTSIGGGEYSAHDGFWHHGGQIFDYNNDQCHSEPRRSLVICCVKVLEAQK